MTKNKQNKSIKIRNIIRNIIIIIFIEIIIINLCSWNHYNNKKTIWNTFGVAIVSSESMEPNLSKNDLIIIKKEETYKQGDVVVYKKKNKLIVHRIIEKNETRIITQGDANPKADLPISISDIYGKVYFCIPFVGRFIIFFKSTYGIISIILFIIILFIYSCKKELDIMSKR